MKLFQKFKHLFMADEDKDKDQQEQNQGECAPSACEGCPLGGSCGPAAGQEEESKTSDPPTPEASDGQGELADEYLAGWQRAKADYTNLLKDMDAMRLELTRYACAGLIKELLPVLDNLKKALEQKPEGAEDEAGKWAEGIGHIRSQFVSVLERAGVTAIDETGVAFDPEVHDAMMREAKKGARPGTVLKVAEPGYKVHDRVIRAAKVIVAE